MIILYSLYKRNTSVDDPTAKDNLARRGLSSQESLPYPFPPLQTNATPARTAAFVAASSARDAGRPKDIEMIELTRLEEKESLTANSMPVDKKHCG
jgi:hypothetical protein